MVNIAFPYKETDASAMHMALNVLQTIAEKGNRYIKACHILLTKIRGTIKPKQLRVVGEHEQSPIGDQSQDTTLSQSDAILPALPPNDNMPFSLDFEGDPALWAEVLESIDIDMDRQWIETALRRGQQSESLDSLS